MLKCVFSVCLCSMVGMATLSGCATPLSSVWYVPEILESKGLSLEDSQKLTIAISRIGFPDQLALSALVPTASPTPKAPALLPSSARCASSTGSDPNAFWQTAISEVKTRGLVDRTLPLDERQQEEALRLLASGQFLGDVQDSLDAIYRLDPALADKILRDLVTHPYQGFELLPLLQQDAHGMAQCASQYLSHLHLGNLNQPTETCRPQVLTHTLKGIYARPAGLAVSDTARAFLRKDNRTMRLAILAYARTQGINITEDNLDQLEQALDKDNPDFYPLLAGAVAALAKEYGVKELQNKMDELQKHDNECRSVDRR